MRRDSILCCALLVAAGCGSKGANWRSGLPAPAGVAYKQAAASPGPDQAAAQAEPRPVAATERRIIYEAEVRVVVPDFAEAGKAIPGLVKKYGGYLADVQVDRVAGERRTGRWQARIPVDRFESFLDAISQLGMPETRQQTAKDVTEEYVDLEARISNSKRLEERILKLLERSEGNIKDVIEVERELGRVRGEIEQMEGRLRYLANRTELTTVTIVVWEQQDYVPPGALSFPARIQRAWAVSLAMLRSFGQHVVVAAVFAAPWIAVLAVLALPVLWLRRRRKLSVNRAADGGQPQKPASPPQSPS